MVILYRASNYELEPAAFKPNRPTWFDKKKCFKSIINALDFAQQSIDRCNMHVILDGPRGNLTNYIESFEHINVRQINANSNAACLSHVYDIYLNEFRGKDVYFVEDDYLHLPHSINMMQDGIHRFGLVTGYDHTDRYSRADDATYQHEIISLGSTHHWKTAESTTCTWAIKGNEDGEKIIKLAKQYLLEDRAFFRHLINTGTRLYTPMPGCTTHMNAFQLSPFADWQSFNNSL